MTQSLWYQNLHPPSQAITLVMHALPHSPQGYLTGLVPVGPGLLSILPDRSKIRRRKFEEF